MNSLPFDKANNWDSFPELRRALPWQTARSNNPVILFEATVGDSHWFVRLNDFPDEPAYTLLIDGTETLHFDDWPSFWEPRPPFPCSNKQHIKPLPLPENRGILAFTKKLLLHQFAPPYNGSLRCALVITVALLLLSSMATDGGGAYTVFSYLSLFFWIAGPIYTLIRPKPNLLDRILIALGPITPLLMLLLIVIATSVVSHK